MRQTKAMKVRAAKLHDYYLELRTIRRNKVAELDQKKEKLARLSTLCMNVKLLAGRTLAAIPEMKVQLFRIMGDERVSYHYRQEKCVKFQTMIRGLDREYYRLQKLQHEIKIKYCKDAKEISIDEKHIVKIDEGLLSIEEDIRALVEPKRISIQFLKKKRDFFKKKEQTIPAYFETSVSERSLNSVTTTASKYSISLGGTLLKQWLGPLIQANAL